MKYNFAAFFFIIFVFLSHHASNAQTKSDVFVDITGTIVDSLTKKAIPGATVDLTYKAPDTIINSQRTTAANSDGSFSFEDVSPASEYSLAISAVGYELIVRKIVVAGNRMQGDSAIVKNIGNIFLTPEPNQLQKVVVTSSSAPSMYFGIDRKVFSVEKNITAKGGTAVDVMKNIPSLSVDVNGNVEMRNSTPQIFIDGRPTILTLEQIPADDIETVELITNPSAKFDASSAGGIINIVLKKNKRVGLSGIASAGAGTPDVLFGNLNFNLRQKMFNVFASGNYNHSGGIAKEETYRENKSNGAVTDYFQQSSENENLKTYNSIRFGVDYFLNSTATLSFNQNFNNGDFNNNQLQHQAFYEKDNTLNSTGIRETDGLGDFRSSSSRLSFEKRFISQEHKLTADITYNDGSRSNKSDIVNNFYNPNGSIYAPSSNVRTRGTSNNYQITGQVDYTNKITDDKRVEFGLRSYYNKSSSIFGTFSVDQSDAETKLPLSNDYEFSEKINAAYANYANKWKGIIYQVGLRMEFSEFDGKLIDSNFNFGYKFPDGFDNLGYAIFPSFFLTKQIDEYQDLQLNYSKRIRRPRFWQINPFIDINDPLNIRQGNPALRPEYTNSFELNYFNRFKENSGSFLAVLYFRNNVGDVTQYSDTITAALYQQLNNAAISPDAIVNTYINAGYTNRTGAELTLQKKLSKSFELTYDIDLQYRTTKANVNKINLSNSGFNFENKLIANYKIISERSKLMNNTSFQLIADYEGPTVIPQGKRKQQFDSDFALRKEFLKNRAASVSFSINDIFNTRRYGTIYDTEEFYQDSYRRWSVRTFRLSFSYRFGDTDINLFKKKSNNENSNDFGAEDSGRE